MKYLRILAVFIGLAFSFNTFVLAASINSIALFNFKPISMDAIGADAELLYSLETSLNKSPQISVMSRRDMEAVLYRIGGAQVTDTDLVIAYGQEMGVSFVLTGEIDKIGSSIQVTIKLVDVIARRISQTWTESYNSRGDVLQHSKTLALAIEQAIIQSSTANDAAASDDSTAEEIEYFHDIKAVAKDSGVFISWVINDDVSAFYTNVYRGESADGLFEFVASVEETQYQDDVQGHYFYRLDLVLDNGSEIKGQQIVSAETFGTVVDTSLQPPTILSSKNLLHGIKIDFVPQLNNQGILGYNFYQKVNDNQWKKVHSIAKGSQLSYSVILDKNFIANADYQLYVTAYSNTGESDHSEILTLHTEPALILKSDGIKRPACE